MKRILTFGDSWVAGGSLTSKMNKVYYDNRHKYEIPYDEKYDSQLFGSTSENTLNARGEYKDNYEFKQSWPGFLNRLVVPSVLNFGEGGISNQQIISKVVKSLSSIFGNVTLRGHESFWLEIADNPDEVFVIVSWTSLYRSEIFNFMKDGEYTTFGIQSIYDNHNGKFSNTELESFLNIISNIPYIIEKYLQQCIYLHFFLKSIGVKHLFFNSFNETTDVIKSVHNHKLIGEDELKREVFKNNHLTMLHEIIPQDIFYGGSLFGNSQLAFLLKQVDDYPLDEEKYKTVERLKGYSRLFLDDMHPSELGNELWSNELYNTEQIQDFLNEE